MSSFCHLLQQKYVTFIRNHATHVKMDPDYCAPEFDATLIRQMTLVSAEQCTGRRAKVPRELDFRVEWRVRHHFTSHLNQTLPVITSPSYPIHLFLKSLHAFMQFFVTQHSANLRTSPI